MTRAQRVREYWESRIPESATEMGLSDAARYLKPVISRRTLQRRAASGRLAAIAGPGTAGLGAYRFRRADLLEYLCSLDTIAVPAQEYVRLASEHTASGPATASSAARATDSPRTTRRRRESDPDQFTLLPEG
jgi:hypothetical protein